MSIPLVAAFLVLVTVADEPANADPGELQAAEKIVLRGHKGAVTRATFIEFNPRANLLASSGEDGSTFLWNLGVAEPAPLSLADFGNVAVWALDCRPDGLIASANAYHWGSQVRLVHPNLRQQKPLATLGDFKRGGGTVNCLAFSPRGSPYLAVGSEDGVIRIWKVANRPNAANDKGEMSIQVIEGLAGAGRAGVSTVAFSPNTRNPLLVAGCRQGSIQLFRVTERPRFGLVEKTSKIHGHSQYVSHVCFSPNGRRLASASYDGSIAVWDVEAEERERLIRGPTGQVNFVEFSPDGGLLASAHDDGTIRLWDPATGKEQLKIQAHVKPVLCVAFDRDGGRLASTSRDHTIKGWALSGPGIAEPDRPRR